LIAEPYHQAYKHELSHVAEALEQASQHATHDGFKKFLRARADGLLRGSLQESEMLWIDVSDSPIDIAIGPYEVYDDGVRGVKASYEATVLVRHRMTESLAEFHKVAPELERGLPGAVASAQSLRKFRIGVYDVAYAAGMTNMGGKAIAATLPNDEEVRSKVGARLLLFRNVISAKFAPILHRLGEQILAPDQLDLLREDAFLYHTLLHEMAHATSECFVREGNRITARSINEALKERYSTIEECRADLIGFVFLDLLARQNFLSPKLGDAAAVTFVVNHVRSLRFGTGNDYGRGAAIILSHLKDRGSLKADNSGRLAVDVQGIQEGVADLAAAVQDIAVRGDYPTAGRLIDHGVLPAEIETLLPRLKDIPVDLEFIFDRSSTGF
jgi:hypothetical protein